MGGKHRLEKMTVNRRPDCGRPHTAKLKISYWISWMCL